VRTTESFRDPASNSESVGESAQFCGGRCADKRSGSGMQVNVSDDAQRTGGAIGQMDRQMPAEGIRVEGCALDIQGHADFTV